MANVLLLQDGITTSGLYCTSSSGVCEAGKRKGLLWEDVAESQKTDVFSRFLRVKCFISCVFLDSCMGLVLDQWKKIMELQSRF